MQRRERTHADLGDKVDWGASVGLDAERQFLGLMLLRGDVFDLAGHDVRPVQFYEPLHRRIFDLITSSRAKGLSISRERLEQLLTIDGAYHQLGGAQYLDQITQAAAVAEVEGVEPREVAKLVVDLYWRREVIAACSEIIRGARADGMLTGAELRDMAERRLLRADFADVQDAPRQIAIIAEQSIAAAKPGGLELLSTGLQKLDERLSKCERGDLILLGGRPSMGKSALAGCMALSAGEAGIPTLEINGEMSDGQVARRHLSDMAHRLYDVRGPTYREIRSGKITGSQRAMLRHAAQVMQPFPLHAMRKRGLTITQLRSIIRRRQNELAQDGKRLGFVFIDHVGIIEPDDPRAMGVQAMAQISKGLKGLAIEFDLVVVALSQLNRSLEQREDKRPTLSDLRESGTLEQDADVVIGVYRDAYYAEREPKPKKAEDVLEWEHRRGDTTMEAICLKVKEGPPGTEKLHADVARNAIRDTAPPFTDRAAPGEFDFGGERPTVSEVDEVPI